MGYCEESGVCPVHGLTCLTENPEIFLPQRVIFGVQQ